MIEIPFHKLHGAENDFLLSWADSAPKENLGDIARHICARTTGIGADGWMLVEKEENALRTRLFNSDGSEAEISGNGTRCAAAFAIAHGVLEPPVVRIVTAAGPKTLRLISRSETKFLFEMDMGQPRCEELHAKLELAGATYDATILDVGNPQCSIFVDTFPTNWRVAAAQAERHPRFPYRSNVSFVRRLDQHAIEAVFFERGAGETRSSGTGSTGAVIAGILRGILNSPVEVHTPAGVLRLRWDDSVYLTGPAEVIGVGKYIVGF